MTTALLSCLSGSAIVYPTEEHLTGPSSVNMPVGAPEVSNDLPGSAVQTAILDAREAPAIGGVLGDYGSLVQIKAVGGTLRVREYLDQNPFADGPAYQDHDLADGQSVTAGTHGSNIATLMVLGV